MALQSKTYSTGSFAYGGDSRGYILDLILTEESVDVIANTSLISYKLQLRSGSSNRFDWEFTSTISLNGSQVASNTAKKNLDYNSTWVLLNGTATIPHSDDGTLSMSYSAELTPWNGGTQYTPPKLTLSGKLKLTDIARESTLSATAAYIGEASTIAVSRQNTALTHSIYYQFGDLYGYISNAAGAISSRETKLTDTTIVFPIPESFYTQIPNDPSGTCILACLTYSGSTRVGEQQIARFTVTAKPENCRPVVYGTAVDTNAATVALTGDNKIFVKSRSDVLCTVNATAQKSASITARYVNSTPIRDTTQTLNDITSASIVFRAVDSRGNETSYTVPNLSMVNYVPVSAVVSAKRDDPTSGAATLTVSGKWFNGSFGTVTNALTVEYREDGGSWIAMTPTKSGGDYSATAAFTGKDYTKRYRIDVRVSDRLDTVTKTVFIEKGIPVFDWGENDFRFNVPVFLANGMTAGRTQWEFDGDADTVVYDAFMRTKPGISNCPFDSGFLLSFAHITREGDLLVALQLSGDSSGSNLAYRVKWYHLDWGKWRHISSTEGE